MLSFSVPVLGAQYLAMFTCVTCANLIIYYYILPTNYLPPSFPLPVMVGCKDDPSHKLRNLPSFHQQSPTQDEQDTRVAHWLRTLSHTIPRSPHTSNSTAEKVQDDLALDPQSIACSHPSKHNRHSANAQSNKRKALTELEGYYPRKSARLEQKQRNSAYKMSTSPSKKKVAGKAREGATRGQERNEAKVSVGHVVTRGRSQGKVATAGSSDKENRIIARDAAAALPRAWGTEMTIPPLQPVEVVLVPPDLGSPPKRKDPSSRPPSPTKSTSTKTSKTPARVDKRERFMLLNPPVEFFTSRYLSALGKNIPLLLRDLWVDHIVSDDEGFIPQALEVCHLQSCTRTDTDERCRLSRDFRRKLRTNRNRKFERHALQATLVTTRMTMREFG